MALFAPFYNFRGKARNFFVTRWVLWWTAGLCLERRAVGKASYRGHGGHRGGQPILTLEPAPGQLPTGLNLFQK